MTTAIAQHEVLGLDCLEVQLLGEEELIGISGGLAPAAAGCLLAAAGAGVAIVGVTIGVVVYLIVN